MDKKVTTYYLEMNHLQEFIPSGNFRQELSIRKIAANSMQHWMLFFGVGIPWKWYSRLKWTLDEWELYLKNPNVQSYVAFNEQEMVGFFELVTQNQETEINFIGLFPESIGKGLGGHLLSHAIHTAWSLNVRKVWLHTCTSDHPVALSNYLARGFKLVKETIEMETIPDKEEYQRLMCRFIHQSVDRLW